MNKLFLQLLIIILFAFFTNYAQTNSFKGITPLYSTRTDVEKIFGKPQNSAQKKYDYLVDNQEISIIYNDKKCSARWNVEKDVVLEIIVVNKDLVDKSFDELKLDESKFFGSTDDAFYTTWTNPIDGLQYYFSNVKTAYISQTFIPKKSDNKLRCKGFPPFAPERNYYTREEYLLFNSELSEVDNLDNLKLRFLNNSFITYGDEPNYQSYALVYFDKRKSLHYWRKYLKNLKNSLLKSFGKKFIEKLTIIEGGLKDSALVEFYFLPKTAPPPSPNPSYPSPQFMKKQ